MVTTALIIMNKFNTTLFNIYISPHTDLRY
jgi:hypothetical protein